VGKCRSHSAEPSIPDKDEVPGSSPGKPTTQPLTSGNADLRSGQARSAGRVPIGRGEVPGKPGRPPQTANIDHRRSRAAQAGRVPDEDLFTDYRLWSCHYERPFTGPTVTWHEPVQQLAVRQHMLIPLWLAAEQASGRLATASTVATKQLQPVSRSEPTSWLLHVVGNRCSGPTATYPLPGRTRPDS